MVIAFQVVLVLIMLFFAVGIPGERDNKDIRDSVLTAFMATLAGFIASVLLL